MSGPLILKRVFIFAAGLVLVLGIAFATLPYTLGGTFARQALEEAVRDASGRTLAFSGQPRMALWPEAYIAFDDVSVPGASPGDPPLATIGTLRLKLAASALLLRRLEIDEIVLERPVVNLLQDGEGRLNFVDGSGDEAPSPAAAEDDAAAAPPLIVEDGTLRYRDLMSGRDFEASEIDATVAMPVPGRPIEFKGNLTWRQRRVELSAYIRSPRRLAAGGSPADIAVASPELSAAFSGRMALNQGLSLAGQVEATSPSLVALARWGGVEIDGVEGLRDLSLSAAIDLSGRTVRFKEAKIGLDGMQGEGEVSVDLSGARPRLHARLRVETLDLNAYAQSAADGNALFDGWRDKPIDLKSLAALNVDADIEAGRLRYGSLATDAARLKVALADGALGVQVESVSLYGGKGHGNLSLAAPGGHAEIRGALELAGVETRALLRDFMSLDAVAARGDLSLSLAAAGRSELELVSTLTGTSRFRFADGTLERVDLPGLLGKARSGAVSGWQAADGARTSFATLGGSFAISDGVAESGDLALHGPDLDIRASGAIDLLRQRLDGRIAVTKPSPAVRISVAGSWTQPAFDAGKGDASARATGQGNSQKEPVAPQ